MLGMMQPPYGIPRGQAMSPHAGAHSPAHYQGKLARKNYIVWYMCMYCLPEGCYLYVKEWTWTFFLLSSFHRLVKISVTGLQLDFDRNQNSVRHDLDISRIIVITPFESFKWFILPSLSNCVFKKNLIK